MNIPESRKQETIYIEVAGTVYPIHREWVSVELDFSSFKVDTLQDALVSAYAYRYGKGTKIENTTDGKFLVVVYSV